MQQWSADLQRELPMNMSLTLNYTGLAGSNLGWGGTTDTLININQLDPKYQSYPVGYTTAQVPNPFYGVAGAGQLAGQLTVARGQLLRPFPQFQDINMLQSTGAHSHVPRRRLSSSGSGTSACGAPTSATPTAS